MKQPDFGSTALICMLTFLMLFVAGVSRKSVVISFFTIACLFTYAIISSPYRARRLFAYLNPWENQSSSGFQIIQSYLAFQNGGLFGSGLGESKQKLFFLPEAHTDFIMSVVGEELGLLGTSSVCLLFVYIILAGYKVAFLQQDNFKKF